MKLRLNLVKFCCFATQVSRMRELELVMLSAINLICALKGTNTVEGAPTSRDTAPGRYLNRYSKCSH